MRSAKILQTAAGIMFISCACLMAQPTNDTFSLSGVIKGAFPADVTALMTSASTELGEPPHTQGTDGKSVWWTWTVPHHGNIYISSVGEEITQPLIAVYRGESIESLIPLRVETNTVRLTVFGGDTLRIATVVPTNVNGTVQLHCGYDQVLTTARIVPGNLLREPSWEGTALKPQFWSKSGQTGGQIGGPGGVDGGTWPHLSQDAAIWQDIPTIPGHEYAIQFAFSIFGCCGNVGVRTWWNDNDLGMLYNWIDEPYWHWANFKVVASNTQSRVKFENIHQVAALDAFSVVDLTAPPAIITQPKSVSTFAGGAASFIVGASGSSPVAYQWLFNGTAINGQTNVSLFVTSAVPASAGEYRAVVTNNFGAVTSAPAALVVETATNAIILVQPYGDTLPTGAYFVLNTVAKGPAPLTYQWFKDGSEVSGATNANLAFVSLEMANGGTYQVQVQSPGGNAWSLPAVLVVTSTNQSGGLIRFWNKFPFGQTNIATIYDINGSTPLSGPAFVAQLYAGPTTDLLRAAGQPSVFYEGESAGIFEEQIITLPNVPPGGSAYTQIRVWERAYGASYESARAAGGRFGRSSIVQVTTTQLGQLPARMIGLQGFNLQTGLPQFSAGVISFVERQPGEVLLWSLSGNAGFRYLIERSSPSTGFDWQPFKTLTNSTGNASFTDSAQSGSHVVLYRSRILD